MATMLRMLTLAVLIGLSGCVYFDDREAPGASTPNNEAGAQPSS